VHALLVCTPNALHSDAVRTALESARHVCVEYPLAHSAREARALFALAERQGKVLHVEHIELLTPGQLQLRARAQTLGPPRGGTLEFTGGFEGWLTQAKLAGSPAVRALARLHRLIDLFGPARIRSARQQSSPKGGYRLELELDFERGGHTRLIESREPGLARGLRWNIECENGTLSDPTAASPQGLFARDLEYFVARVTQGAPSYVEEQRIVHALDLVAEIENLTD